MADRAPSLATSRGRRKRRFAGDAAGRADRIFLAFALLPLAARVRAREAYLLAW